MGGQWHQENWKGDLEGKFLHGHFIATQKCKCSIEILGMKLDFWGTCLHIIYFMTYKYTKAIYIKCVAHPVTCFPSGRITF